MEFPTKPLLRKSGLVFSGLFFTIFYLVPYLLHNEQKNTVLIICSIVVSTSLISPYRLRLPYILWIKLGEILSKINSKLILSLFFYCLITPFAIFRKIISFFMTFKQKNKSNYIYLDDSAINLKDEY